jgi:hypothetical protein
MNLTTGRNLATPSHVANMRLKVMILSTGRNFAMPSHVAKIGSTSCFHVPMHHLISLILPEGSNDNVEFFLSSS